MENGLASVLTLPENVPHNFDLLNMKSCLPIKTEKTVWDFSGETFFSPFVFFIYIYIFLFFSGDINQILFDGLTNGDCSRF